MEEEGFPCGGWGPQHGGAWEAGELCGLWQDTPLITGLLPVKGAGFKASLFKTFSLWGIFV